MQSSREYINGTCMLTMQIAGGGTFPASEDRRLYGYEWEWYGYEWECGRKTIYVCSLLSTHSYAGFSSEVFKVQCVFLFSYYRSAIPGFSSPFVFPGQQNADLCSVI